jgi:hypothetical protein
MSQDSTLIDRAEESVAQGAAVAAKLEVGPWKSVRTPALVSMAMSLRTLVFGAFYLRFLKEPVSQVPPHWGSPYEPCDG